MTYKIFSAAFVLLFLMVPRAGRAGSEGGSPLDLFNHDKHHEYIAEAKVDCAVCHKTDDSYNREKVYKKGCHHCHNNPRSPSLKAARFKCTTCHKNLEDVKPDDHNLNWMSHHQTVAKENKEACLKCHKSYYCTDCHQNRDTVDQKSHSSLYRYSHSIEARGNPKKCSQCHTVKYCKDCHEKHED